MESKLIRDLVRVIKRLSVNNTLVRQKYDNFAKTVKLVENKKRSYIWLKDKQEISEMLELYFYHGKVMAYMWVLIQLVGEEQAQELLLKGIKGEKNIDKYGRRIKK